MSDEETMIQFGYRQDTKGRWLPPTMTSSNIGVSMKSTSATGRSRTPTTEYQAQVVNTESLLAERGETHGDYRDHALYSQELKRVMGDALKDRVVRNQPPLTDTQMETLSMIAHKIGRILAGNPNFPDHWDDIAGYAKLISKEIARG